MPILNIAKLPEQFLQTCGFAGNVMQGIPLVHADAAKKSADQRDYAPRRKEIRKKALFLNNHLSFSFFLKRNDILFESAPLS